MKQYQLHSYFEFEDCTFLSGDKGVVYSPYNSETLLCDKSVIAYLQHLASGENLFLATEEFLRHHHKNQAQELLNKLLLMKVIQTEESS